MNDGVADWLIFGFFCNGCVLSMYMLVCWCCFGAMRTMPGFWHFFFFNRINLIHELNTIRMIHIET